MKLNELRKWAADGASDQQWWTTIARVKALVKEIDAAIDQARKEGYCSGVTGGNMNLNELREWAANGYPISNGAIPQLVHSNHGVKDLVKYIDAAIDQARKDGYCSGVMAGVDKHGAGLIGVELAKALVRLTALEANVQKLNHWRKRVD